MNSEEWRLLVEAAQWIISGCLIIILALIPLTDFGKSAGARQGKDRKKGGDDVLL